MSKIDELTGYSERPLSWAPRGQEILAKSKNGSTYMKVWLTPDGVWCFAGGREVARPQPAIWLVPIKEAIDG